MAKAKTATKTTHSQPLLRQQYSQAARMLPTLNCGHGSTLQQAATYTMWQFSR
jgi:hypothetical protein